MNKTQEEYERAESVFRLEINYLNEHIKKQQGLIEKMKCCGSCIHAHLANIGLGCFNPTLTATGEPDDYNVTILEGVCDEWEGR